MAGIITHLAFVGSCTKIDEYKLFQFLKRTGEDWILEQFKAGNIDVLYEVLIFPIEDGLDMLVMRNFTSCFMGLLDLSDESNPDIYELSSKMDKESMSVDSLIAYKKNGSWFFIKYPE